MTGRLTLVTGGARSGKSRCAIQLALETGGPVLVIATGVVTDPEMSGRIGQHRASRPAAWPVLEARYDIATSLHSAWRGERCLLLEDLPTLITNLLVERSAGEAEVQAELEGLLSFPRTRSADLVVVSGEVGLGIVPEGALARQFRDLLGLANQHLAAAADRVLLLVAGLPVQLKG